MARRYHVLVGKSRYTHENMEDARFEVIFGDYDRKVVVQEKEDTSREEWRDLQIHTIPGDTQTDVDRALRGLNAGR